MIAIITYDTAHRKTQDILSQLLLRGYSDLFLIVLPFFERKNFVPLFKHRPDKVISIDIETLTNNLNIGYAKLNAEDIPKFVEDKEFKHILIAGAGILPKQLAQNYNIINSHPGYLPYSKGLDSLKWAIFNQQPIGVTSHYISDTADEGVLIEQNKVAVYFDDSFYQLAMRVYEMEIKMIVDAIEIIETGQAVLTSLANNEFKPTRRMSHHMELKMLKRFDLLKLNS